MPTAIVTGCLGAIGDATCAALASDGFELIGVDCLAGAHFEHGAYHLCDLAEADDVNRFLKTLRSGGARPTLLVNNAGYYDPKPFFETTLEDFERSLRINTRAVFQLSQAVARWMIEDGVAGSIVNIASIAGKLGSPIVPYGTSKAAVIGLTRSMAKALAGDGIRVNAVAPGMISSRMTGALAAEQLRAQLANTPMGRLGEPEEVAKLVCFLAGSGASYMTGSIVDVAGGWTS